MVGTVGNDLKMDYTAIGDTTNLASRLQTLAPPGEILISESTHRLVRGFFARASRPARSGSSGKSEPVTAYERARTGAARPRGSTSPRSAA